MTTTQRRFQVFYAQDADGQDRAIRVYEHPSIPGGDTLETPLAQKVQRIKRGVYDVFDIVNGRPTRVRVTSNDPQAP